jgi:aldehyde dehydrogenase (NAD+)
VQRGGNIKYVIAWLNLSIPHLVRKSLSHHLLFIEHLRKVYRTGKTRPIEFRKKQLNQLLKGLHEMKAELQEGIQKDLQMSPYSSYFGHIWALEGDIHHTLSHLSTWMQAD